MSLRSWFRQMLLFLAVLAGAQHCDDEVSQLQLRAASSLSDWSPLTSIPLRRLGQLGQATSVIVGGILVLVLVILTCTGFPRKVPRHESVEQGCPTRLLVLMCAIYASTSFTVEQYVPYLPEMEHDLMSTQSLMSGSVQVNFFLKGVVGTLAGAISDNLGRKPVLLVCSLCLMLGSFLCACATSARWFMLARVIQGTGEAAEPVVVAIVIDYFADTQMRLGTLALLECSANLATAVAPVFGALMGKHLHWRASFIVLGVLWGVIPAWTACSLPESAPDHVDLPKFNALWKISTGRGLLSFLVTQSLILSPCVTFDANNSYLLRGVYKWSPEACAWAMMIFSLLGALGAACVALSNNSAMKVSQVSIMAFAAVGLISIGLGLSLGVWGYVLGSFLQAFTMIAAFTAVSTLYFEHMEDCAGMAAALQVFVQDVPPSMISALSTVILVTSGPYEFTIFQASLCVLAGLVFWVGYSLHSWKVG